MRLFGGSQDRDTNAAQRGRVERHSTGWDALRQFLAEAEGQRTLDIGPTSSTNINLLTGMGHSVYMADLVTESQDAQWTETLPGGEKAFRADAFLTEALQLGERSFDIVLLWDCLDYLPQAAVAPTVSRIHDAMTPGGKCLLFSHIKLDGNFSRYHLRQDAAVDVQAVGDVPARQVYTNRQIEGIFSSFRSYKFFLAKDNLREVLVTR